jgi:predicted glycoside hydrolase/deacetylase ChbG (UPF0249 family)
MVADAGIIKNLSLMAPGPFVEEAAEVLKNRREVCFGMHTTLNAEWDNVKWKPVSDIAGNSGLTDERGFFLPDPKFFAETKPDVELVMAEVSAQFEKLAKLGFDLKYIDSHMFPERFIDGLDEAIADFARRRGILDHMYFYNLPPRLEDFTNPENLPQYLKSIPEGQYFIVIHPSLDTDEMRRTGNAYYRGEDIAKARAGETKLFSDAVLAGLLKEAGIQTIRYDEAAFDSRAAVDELRERYKG